MILIGLYALPELTGLAEDGVLKIQIPCTRTYGDRVAYARYEFYYHGCDLYRDPWIVPEVRNAIKLAQQTGENTRCSSRLSILPLEVCLLITEIICPFEYSHSDVENTRDMLSVFGWTLPDWFWRSRLQLNAIFSLS